MLHRLLLPGLLVLVLCCVACKGKVATVPYLPVSNFLALNLNASEATIDPGTVFQAVASAIPIGLSTPVDLSFYCTWRSTDPSVASVDGVGIISGNSPGTAVITATLTDEFGQSLESSTLFVLVTGTPSGPVAPVVLSSLEVRNSDGSAITTTIRIAKTEVILFDVLARYSDGSSGPISGVSWRVSDPTIALITAGGELQPIKAGVIAINARLGSLESNYIVVQITN